MRARIKSIGNVDDCSDWVTGVGQLVDVKRLQREGPGFFIKNPLNGVDEYCLVVHCAHLGCGEWELIDDDIDNNDAYDRAMGVL